MLLSFPKQKQHETPLRNSTEGFCTSARGGWSEFSAGRRTVIRAGTRVRLTPFNAGPPLLAHNAS